MADSTTIWGVANTFTFDGSDVNSNTQQWLGTTVATPTVGGVPEVDLTHLEGATAVVTVMNRLFQDAVSSTINDGSPKKHSFDTNLTSAVDDDYRWWTIVFYDGNNAGHARRVVDYNGTTKVLILDEPFPSAFSNGDSFILYNTNYVPRQKHPSEIGF